MEQLISKSIGSLTLVILFVGAQMKAQQISEKVSIAGHRGGYYFDYPESSLGLLTHIASQFNKDTIIAEIDLRISKNGTIYIMHDETVDRTTNGSGKINQLENAYLNKLYLKKENGEITDKEIPTFEEVLTFIQSKNINLMLDIKNPIHAEAFELVKKYRMENRMLVLTFNMELTKKVATFSTHSFLSALIESERDWDQYKEIKLPIGKKIAYVNSKTPTLLIEELKRNKIKIMADVSEAQKYAGKPLDKMGYQRKIADQLLDILITDFPIEAREALIPR